MSISDRQIADLVTGTLDRLGRLRFVQLAQRLQDYEVMGRMIKKDQVSFEDGTGIERRVMIDHSGAAKMAKLYDPDVVSVGDVLSKIDIPWRHSKTHYAFERRELLMNRGSSKIVDLLKVRRADAMISMAELLEDQVWQAAPATATNTLDVFSIPYWVVYNATTGFNGGNPGSETDCGGINSTVVTRWKNYTAKYTNVTKTDLISKLRTAYRKIKFKSPVSVNDFRKGAGDTYRLYTNETVLNAMELLGEAQNENLGRDLASMDGTLTFKRNPIIWVPRLDENDVVTDPVYMLNMSCFNPVVLKGDVMRESDPKDSADDHNVKVVHVDLTWNMLCTDRRRQALVAKSAA